MLWPSSHPDGAVCSSPCCCSSETLGEVTSPSQGHPLGEPAPEAKCVRGSASPVCRTAGTAALCRLQGLGKLEVQGRSWKVRCVIGVGGSHGTVEETWGWRGDAEVWGSNPAPASLCSRNPSLVSVSLLVNRGVGTGGRRGLEPSTRRLFSG